MGRTIDFLSLFEGAKMKARRNNFQREANKTNRLPAFPRLFSPRANTATRQPEETRQQQEENETTTTTTDDILEINEEIMMLEKVALQLEDIQTLMLTMQKKETKDTSDALAQDLTNIIAESTRVGVIVLQMDAVLLMYPMIVPPQCHADYRTIILHPRAKGRSVDGK